jgi:hypothetical protein
MGYFDTGLTWLLDTWLVDSQPVELRPLDSRWVLLSRAGGTRIQVIAASS